MGTTFICVQCGQQFTTEEPASGLEIQCPNCAGSLIVPLKAEASQDGETLTQIAEKLAQRSTAAEEGNAYELEQSPILIHASPAEVERAMDLKQALSREYEGVRVEDVYEAVVEQTQFGVFLHLVHKMPWDFRLFDPEAARAAINCELKLLKGVGPVRDRMLRLRGTSKLSDLSDDPQWASEARHVVNCLETGDLKAIESRLRRWLPRSHPLALRLAQMVEQEGIAFFDLESMGLFGRPIFLFGLAHIGDGLLEVHQFLARDVAEELPALAYTFEQLQSAKALVTYNGRAFDVNYVLERLSYYAMPADFDPVHLDLLAHARRLYRDSLPDVRLETVERHIVGGGRDIELPGTLVPDFYSSYLETKNIGPLVAILEHNKQDLMTLCLLLKTLCAS